MQTAESRPSEELTGFNPDHYLTGLFSLEGGGNFYLAGVGSATKTVSRDIASLEVEVSNDNGVRESRSRVVQPRRGATWEKTQLSTAELSREELKRRGIKVDSKGHDPETGVK